MTTVMYEFRNTQSRTMTAQAIPSYAPGVAQSHFTKVECFCFTQHTLAPGESKTWPVIFYVDDKLPKDVKTITLSYTFFEVGGTTPPAPVGPARTPSRMSELAMTAPVDPDDDVADRPQGELRPDLPRGGLVLPGHPTRPPITSRTSRS